MVKQGGVEGRNRRFLAAVLAGCRREDAADFPNQRTRHPEGAGLIEEVAHLRRHVSEPCRRPKDYGVIIGEVRRRGERRVLVGFHAAGFRHLLGDKVGNTLEIAGDPGDRFYAVRDGVSHGFGVAISRVVKNKDFRHEYLRKFLRQGVGRIADPP